MRSTQAPGPLEPRNDQPTPAGLAWHDRGATSGDRLVLVHGFTQTAHCWAPFDELLGATHPIRAVDAPGHGSSGHADATLPVAAALLGAAGSADSADSAASYVGYSMGGRIALRLAVDSPEHVRRLVLIGASPGIADVRERAERQAADERLADHIRTIGVDAFVEQWLAQPLFAGLPAERAHRSERRRNRATALAASLRASGTGAQEPLWDRLAALRMPVLLVAGADDVKFCTIAGRMAAAIGANARLAFVEGAGHTAHLEQPERTAALVLDWLATS